MIRSLAAILGLSAASTMFGQVVGVGTFIHVVADLDKTIRFYGNDLGLELTGSPGPRAFSANTVVEGLYDAKGSQSRVAVLRIPGSPLGVEFVEFKGVSQRPVHRNIQDPGAGTLVLKVPDLDAAKRRLEQDGGRMAGQWIAEDPDGFLVELVQSGESGAGLMLTVGSTDRTLKLFRDVLGFQPEVGNAFVKDKDRFRALSLPKASYRSSASNVPGTSFKVEFVEFKGVTRHAVSPGIHDPGAGVLRLLVRDFDSTFSQLKAAGVPVMSAGAEPVTIGGGRRAVILRDPDGFFFQLLTAPAPVSK
jgi:catechol 2,3-dioxygenase-like lactoylglutathione lyase family enzyme